MKRTRIAADLSLFPSVFHSLLANAEIWDSSCSPEARVFYIPKDGGVFLKSAPAGTLAQEAEMGRCFHSIGMSAEVLCYISEQQDWLLTRQLAGEDCLDPKYLSDPHRLTEILAQQLLGLHGTLPTFSPSNATASYLAQVRTHYKNHHFDPSLFPDNWGYDTPEAAWTVIEQYGHLLQSDTLIHGDYCLPNILLDDWRFSGFIDLGGAGMGDRHLDLFWGAWSLGFNLKDDRWGLRFLDAYGKENYQPEILSLIAACEVFR